MNSSWINTKISDFLAQSENTVTVVPHETYPLLGMSLEGRGLFLREKKLGAEIGSKTLNKVIPGQFVYSRLFAWKGAFDYVRDEFAGAYVSDEYPTFTIDESKVDLKFLHYYFNQEKIWKQVEAYCIGVTKASRNRFKEAFFKSLYILLPPIAEQQNIVNKIEKIKSKLIEISKFREAQDHDLSNLIYSKYIESIKSARWLPMCEVAPIHRRQVEVNPEETYFEIGVRSFGKGLFENPNFKGSDLTWEKPYWMKEGDLLFSNIKAWEGAVALIPKKYDGWVGSHRYITCLPNTKIVNPQFLYYYFQTFEGVEQLSLASPGTVDRNRTLNNKLLNEIKVPLPSLKLQESFAKILNISISIKEEYSKTRMKIKELIPALLDKAYKNELYFKYANTQILKIHTAKTDLTPIVSIAKAKTNEDLELAIIIALMESRLGNTYGDVGIQKTVFNLEAFSPVLNKKYNFVNYHFGTYSAELKEKIKNNPFLGKKTIRNSEVYSVLSEHNKTVLDAISDKANKGFVLAINKLLDLYTTPFIARHTDKIELLNTVTKLILDLQTADANAIYKRMQEWEIKQTGFKTKADKFTLADTTKIIALLTANGLLQKLIK